MMRYVLTLSFLLINAACLSPATPAPDDIFNDSNVGQENPGASSQVNFEIVDNPHSTVSGMSLFTQYIEVLGLGIYAEANVDAAYVLHAAHIMAELLDNDEDGVVDDQAVWAELLSQEALVPIFMSEGSPAEDEFFDNYRGNGVGAVLYNNEIDPSQPGHWGADATIEEIMHTINSVGHRVIYPAAFDLEPNSSKLTQAMDVARGGQFIAHPGTYPDDAWYHYDDTTCDYGCMAIEYFYWAQVSNMGILDDAQTCAGIANEWEPCSRALLESMDVLMYALITDPQYKLPQLAPNGAYEPVER
jgi:hypothetical protein